ncbi:hypothetical protein [Streptomyces sp. NPDC052225]|uniref:hypothetical protein n=1 Tax=Streptomyces sp. NPDC052225 TaxID=3154949 RepID=UPI00341DE962
MAELHTSAPTHPSNTQSPQPAGPDSPRWVNYLTDLGRPIVAAWVMIMCAPGEHHLGRLAGWSDHLAWGMAGVLAAYAGIAAAVASKRPKGAPGKRSAVAGAWLSLGTAMSAQPVSHLFVTGHWTADPRPPVWLIVTVSCVPPLVLGHLLHLAATPVPAAAVTPVAPPVTTPTAPVTTPVDAPARSSSWTQAVPADVDLLPIVARTTTAPPVITYTDPRCAVVRALYDGNTRPGTKAMREAISAAGFDAPSDGVIRGQLRAEVEMREPHLALLPPAPVAIGA